MNIVALEMMLRSQEEVRQQLRQLAAQQKQLMEAQVRIEQAMSPALQPPASDTRVSARHRYEV